jgi:putative ABC transport system permease protein
MRRLVAALQNLINENSISNVIRYNTRTGGVLMDTIIQDLRYGARALWKQPAFTLIAVLTLSVGIGANTAIFSVVNATLLRTLPFKDPESLMKVSLTAPGRRGQPARDDLVWSYPKYKTLREQQQVFEDVALYAGRTFNLTGVDEAERLRGEVVSAAYFPILGIAAQVGRTFLPEEDATPQTHMVAVLGHGLWERSFGGDKNVAGKTIILDATSYTVVGVLPPGFQGLTGTAEVWLPMMIHSAEDLGQRWSHSYEAVARRKPGVSEVQAKSAVELLGARINEAHPDPTPGLLPWGAKARTLDETRIDPALRRSVLILWGAVACVLLIACVNIANLLLARGSTRQREIAIRLAVGASRRRLVRQLLTESTLLALVGAFASLALAYWGVELLGAINPTTGNTFGRRVSGLSLIGFNSIRLDASALMFTFGIALLTGFLFGLVPAIQASRADMTNELKSGGSQAAGLGGIRALTSKSILVVAEVALALVLLVGSGLMIKSFGRLLATRSGVDPEALLTLRINLPALQYNREASTAFFKDLETRISGLPGVLSVGMSNCHPLAGGCNGTLIWFRDRPEVARGTEPLVGIHFVSPDYFKTLKIPLVRGRWFTPSDREGAPKVVLISDGAAKKFWPNEDPIGKPIGVGQGGFGDRAEVIGIVGDVRYGQMDEAPQPDVYISHLQSARNSLVVFARVAGNPIGLTQAVRETVRSLNKDLPVFDIKSMHERISDSTSRARFSAALLAIFAGVALVLAAVGIYGVMSYAVTQRTREIGIRIALGAQPGNVLSLVLFRGLMLTLIGIAIGVVAALASTRVLTTLLYEVKPTDPATYVIIAAVLGAVALLATYIPARRATVVDPLTALREE